MTFSSPLPEHAPLERASRKENARNLAFVPMSIARRARPFNEGKFNLRQGGGESDNSFDVDAGVGRLCLVQRGPNTWGSITL
jgi:hypothetical protein